MESKNGGTTGTTGMAENDGLTCYNHSQGDHISCNCPNCDLIKKFLKPALIRNDFMTAENGRLRMDATKGGVPSG
jgi:7-cyano-7-deazaguanine synthase in queuosine biosynthesis